MSITFTYVTLIRDQYHIFLFIFNKTRYASIRKENPHNFYKIIQFSDNIRVFGIKTEQKILSFPFLFNELPI